MQEFWNLSSFATACLTNQDVHLVVMDSFQYGLSCLPYGQLTDFMQLSLPADNRGALPFCFLCLNCGRKVLEAHLNFGTFSALSFRRFCGCC